MKNETPLIKVGETMRTGTEIRKNLWKKFKRMVKSQYGQSKWFLSYEVNEALDLYLRVRNGELLVFDKEWIEKHTDYAHTDGHLYESESLIVIKFKESFKEANRIHVRELRNFVLDDLGWKSRTKYYDIRDELLAKGYLTIIEGNKMAFDVHLRPKMDAAMFFDMYPEEKPKAKKGRW